MKNTIKKRTKRYSKSIKKDNIKNVVLREISKKLEVKRQSLVSSYNNYYNVINDARVLNLMPVIAQGVGQGDRIGNNITIKKMVLMVNLVVDPTSTLATTPSYVDLYIFKFKKNNVAPPSASDMSRFLQTGNSANAYNGESFDGLRDLNEDLFSKKKHLRLNMIHGQTINNYSGYGFMRSNYTLKFDITKYVKSRLLYDDTTNQPTNDNLYLAVGHTQFTQLGVPIDTYLGIYDALINIEYTDA